VSVEVVTVMNRIPNPIKEPYYKPHVFLKSLERFGVKPTVLGLNEPWGGLMTKPRRLRQWLRAGNCKSDLLIYPDAFDVVFTAAPEEVGEAYREHWPWLPVLFNAERDMFPPGDLQRKYADLIGPWKYLNGGVIMGPPDQILKLLEAMWLDEIHDDHPSPDELHGGAGRQINPHEQGWYHLHYAAQVNPIDIDHQCKLLQCLSSSTLQEFDLSGERIKNVVMGSTPLVYHFNGGSKNDLMPIFLKKWGLE